MKALGYSYLTTLKASLKSATLSFDGSGNYAFSATTNAGNSSTGSSGSFTAYKALRDGSGNIITSTYGLKSATAESVGTDTSILARAVLILHWALSSSGSIGAGTMVTRKTYAPCYATWYESTVISTNTTTYHVSYYYIADNASATDTSYITVYYI